MAANPSGDPTHTRFTSQFHLQLLHSHSLPHSQPDRNRVVMPPPSAKPPFSSHNSTPPPHHASSAFSITVKREQEEHQGSAQIGGGPANNGVHNPLYQKQCEKRDYSMIRQVKREQENHQGSAETGRPANNAVNSPANIGVNSPPYQKQSEKGSKHNAKGKIPKNSMSCCQKSSAELANSVSLANNCRYDSSLGLLTRKFVSLVQEAKDGNLDLNHTAEALEVQKRRIYDITNVLEGINLIEKTTKNHVHWKGSNDSCPKDIEDQVIKLKAEVRSLNAEEHRLDDLIRIKQERLRFLEEGEDTQRYLFLTEQDMLSLPSFQNQTVIAIKAPHASYIEVPDPDEDTSFSQRQYKMTIKSTTGPIDLYLLSKHRGPAEDVAVKQAESDQFLNGSRSDVEDSVLSLEDRSDLLNSSESFVSNLSEASGMQRITPAICHIEDDYWFQSDPSVKITDLWE